MSKNLPFNNTAESRLVWNLMCVAKRVRDNAYAPYSNFLVGCAIFAEDHIYSGCNVECVDYDGTHAEEAALAAMVADGVYRPLLIVVVGGLREAVDLSAGAPCGKCRQKLYEFVSLNDGEFKFVDLVGADSYRLIDISKLLPRAFGPASIGMDLAKYRR